MAVWVNGLDIQTLRQTAFCTKEFVCYFCLKAFLFCDFTRYEMYVHVNDSFNEDKRRLYIYIYIYLLTHERSLYASAK